MTRKSLALLGATLSTMLVVLVALPVNGTAAPQRAAAATASPTATPGGPASPTPTPSPTTTPPASDPDDPSSITYDIDAVGASVAGELGAVVQIKVGLINHGPSPALGHAGQFGGRQGFAVVLPPGTQVVGDPRGCENADLVIGFSAQGCHLGTLRAGESILLILDIRIVGPVTGQGTVSRFFAAGVPTAGRDPDTNRANNTAAIKVRVIEAGPILPATGSPTGALAATGAVIVLVGALLLIVTRRRARHWRAR